MFYFNLLLSVAALWTLAVISPGPNFLITARLSIARSRRDGLQAVTGIGVGTAIWGAAGCFGVQALFVAAPWMYLTTRMMGAAYLIYMGLQLLWQSRRPCESDHLGEPSGQLRISAFRLGLLTTIANPRSAVSVASIFVTTMPSHSSLALSFSVMALMVGISIGWYAFVACLLTVRWLADGYRQCRRWIDRVAGACLILFGARLAAER